MDNFIVISGGPGSGKTSLIQALADHGMHCMPEAGRAIIQDQREIGGLALPWADRQAFAELMLGWELRSYREARSREGPIFFDRAIPDVIGYLSLCGVPAPDHLREAAGLYRYNRRVFIAPHWPAIYRQDGERHQSAGEAAATCDAVCRAYVECGYELLPLPLASVEQRVAFIRTRLGLLMP